MAAFDRGGLDIISFRRFVYLLLPEPQMITATGPLASRQHTRQQPAQQRSGMLGARGRSGIREFSSGDQVMRAFWCITLFALVVSSSAGQDKAGTTDKDKFQGTWSITSGTKDGKEMPADKVKGAKIVFEGDKVIAKSEGKNEEATFKLDAGKKPKEIDLTLPNGEMLSGIYEMDGDTLKIALGDNPGSMRPKDFKSKEAQNNLLVLKRDKVEKK
jgi:uncharacterized protein (TIGR03067 family)